MQRNMTLGKRSITARLALQLPFLTTLLCVPPSPLPPPPLSFLLLSVLLSLLPTLNFVFPLKIVQVLINSLALLFLSLVHLLQFLDMLVEDLKSALALKQFEKARQLVSSTYIHTTIMCILPVRLSFNIYFSLYSIEITSFTFYDSHDLMHSPFPLSPFSPFSSLFLPLTKVRFLADLVNAKVVGSSSIMSLFDTFITVTYEPDIPQVVQTFIEWLHLSYDSHMTPMWHHVTFIWLIGPHVTLMWHHVTCMWLVTSYDSWPHVTLMWLLCDLMWHQWLPVASFVSQVRSDWYVYMILSALPWVSATHTHTHDVPCVCYWCVYVGVCVGG